MHRSIQVSSVSSQIFRMTQKSLGMGTLGVEIKTFWGGTWLLNPLEAFDFGTSVNQSSLFLNLCLFIGTCSIE